MKKPPMGPPPEGFKPPMADLSGVRRMELDISYQGNLDTVFLPGVRCHPLDPSAGPEYDASIPARGVSCKTIFDCTVPFAQKKRFARAQFMEVDPRHWLPDWRA